MMFSVMNISVVTREDKLQCEFGFYSSHVNRAAGETPVASEEQDDSKNECSRHGQAPLATVCTDLRHGQKPHLKCH